MKQRIGISKYLLLVVFIIGLPVHSNAQYERRKLLRGIKTVNVFPYLTEASKKLGLTEEEIKTAVELKLQTSGIRVSAAMDSNPQMQIIVNSTSGQQSVIGFNVSMNLVEPCILGRNPKLSCAALTWGCYGNIGISQDNAFREGAKKLVSDVVDVFLNDYLAVNPK